MSGPVPPRQPADPPTTDCRTGSRAALRALAANRDYRLLLIGGTVSQAGSSISYLAYPLLALAMTGSALDAGLVTTVSFVARLLGQIPAGHLADTVDRRRLLVGTDVVHAALLTTIAVMAVGHWYSTAVLLLLTAIGSVTSGIDGPARVQALRVVVDRRQLAEATAANSGRGYALELVTPATGGALFSLYRALPFAADALSFVISAICTARIQTPLGPDRGAPATRFARSFTRSWSLLWTDRFLRATSIYSAATNLLVSMLLFIVVFGVGMHQTSALVAGTAVTLAACAGLAGSTVAPVVQRRWPLHAVLCATGLTRAVFVGAAFVVDDQVLRVVALMAVMATSPVAAAAMSTARMLIVDPDVQGRIEGTSRIIAGVTQPAAPLAAGLLVQGVGPGNACALLSLGFIVLAVAVAVERSLRVWSSA